MILLEHEQRKNSFGVGDVLPFSLADLTLDVRQAHGYC